jgi:hypothetical protein
VRCVDAHDGCSLVARCASRHAFGRSRACPDPTRGEHSRALKPNAVLLAATVKISTAKFNAALSHLCTQLGAVLGQRFGADKRTVTVDLGAGSIVCVAGGPRGLGLRAWSW